MKSLIYLRRLPSTLWSRLEEVRPLTKSDTSVSRMIRDIPSCDILSRLCKVARASAWKGVATLHRLPQLPSRNSPALTCSSSKGSISVDLVHIFRRWLPSLLSGLLVDVVWFPPFFIFRGTKSHQRAWVCRSFIPAITSPLFRCLQNSKILQDSPSHQIFERIHEVLNIVK